MPEYPFITPANSSKTPCCPDALQCRDGGVGSGSHSIMFVGVYVHAVILASDI